MIKYHNSGHRHIIADLIDDDFIIRQTQDALDLMSETGSNDCNRIIISARNLHKDFFNLKTGLAGDILQKFSNYNFRLAIVGDFTKFQSKSLQDFIRESNRGNRIFFVENTDTAIKKLTSV
ncbi:MAG: hypothetical protein QG611_485 [Bacteroidota bacterium]|nr:hypothetical protein [Bacteroidota bacterium]